MEERKTWAGRGVGLMLAGPRLGPATLPADASARHFGRAYVGAPFWQGQLSAKLSPPLVASRGPNVGGWCVNGFPVVISTRPRRARMRVPLSSSGRRDGHGDHFALEKELCKSLGRRAL